MEVGEDPYQEEIEKLYKESEAHRKQHVLKEKKNESEDYKVSIL